MYWCYHLCTHQEIQCLPSDMKNVMSVPSATHIIFQGLGKLLTLKIRCFVANIIFLQFCALLCETLQAKLDFIWINEVRRAVAKPYNAST